jgi:hypothetical protein
LLQSDRINERRFRGQRVRTDLELPVAAEVA